MKRLFLALAALLALTAGAAEAATPPRGAFTYVGNVDDGSRSGVVDARRLGSSAVSRVDTALDSGDDMTVGDVLGDGFDEVVVADDGEGRIDIHDTSAKTTTSFDTRIGFNVNLIQGLAFRAKAAYDYQFRNPGDFDEGILWGGLQFGVGF